MQKEANYSIAWNCIMCDWQKGERKTFSFSHTITIQDNDSFVWLTLMPGSKSESTWFQVGAFPPLVLLAELNFLLESLFDSSFGHTM